MKRSCKRLDIARRRFLKGGATAAAGAAASAVMPAGRARAEALARVDYPRQRLANVADLAVDEPLDIAYPDGESPGILVKLGIRVAGGVGPEGDIVAYSVLCPHQGFTLLYQAADKTLNCPGHYSRFDCEMEGQQIWGHANHNLPMFRLAVDGEGDIFAEGVDDLIYGRVANVLEGGAAP